MSPYQLPIPAGVLRQHVGVLGKTGAGKSSALRGVVEYLLDAGKRVCVIDPKGDWWGLAVAADGKSPGFPVVAMGDFRDRDASDVPINPNSGKDVAELIASGNRPCVLGFCGWMPADMREFWLGFAPTIFNANTGELYLVVDEVHNYAPKGQIKDVNLGKCLHWTNRLLSEGRGAGLVCLIASQRPQKVHNDTLTRCETLVAMRVNHPADRTAIKEWIDGCGDPEQGKVVLNSLALLPRGEAYVWSPEIGFGPKRVVFPMFSTFDSFAPPQVQKKVSDSGWADVDLDAVKEKLASVILAAKENDPKELKAEIAKLRAQLKSPGKLAAAPAPVTVREVVEVKVPVLTDENQKALQAATRSVETATATLRGAESTLKEILERTSARLQVAAATPAPASHLSRASRISAPPLTASSEGDLEPGQKRILDIMAMLKARGLTPNREMIARWHRTGNRRGIHPDGGTYGQHIGALRAKGLLTAQGYDLTPEGERLACPADSGFEAACSTVDAGQERILRALAANPEIKFTRDTLAGTLGLHPDGGTFGQNIGRLRVMGLIPQRNPICLTPEAVR